MRSEVVTCLVETLARRLDDRYPGARWNQSVARSRGVEVCRRYSDHEKAAALDAAIEFEDGLEKVR